MEKCQCLRLLCPDAADYLVYCNVSVVLISTKGNPQLFQTNLQEFGNCYDHHVSIHSADHHFRVSLLRHVLNIWTKILESASSWEQGASAEFMLPLDEHTT